MVTSTVHLHHQQQCTSNTTTNSSTSSSSSVAIEWSARPLVVLLSVVLLLLLLLITPAAGQDNPVRYVRADELRDHSGRCFDASRCALRSVGDQWTVHTHCERALCHVASNGTLLEKRTRCSEPSPLLSEECYIVRVEGRPFPQCCPKLFCNNKPVTPDFIK